MSDREVSDTVTTPGSGGVQRRLEHHGRSRPAASEQKVARVQIRNVEVAQHDGASVVCAQVDASVVALLACAHIAITRQSVRTQVDEVLAIGEVRDSVVAIRAPKYEPVATPAAPEPVIARAAREAVVAGLTDEGVVARAADEAVIVGAANSRSSPKCPTRMSLPALPTRRSLPAPPSSRSSNPGVAVKTRRCRAGRTCCPPPPRCRRRCLNSFLQSSAEDRQGGITLPRQRVSIAESSFPPATVSELSLDHNGSLTGSIHISAR